MSKIEKKTSRFGDLEEMEVPFNTARHSKEGNIRSQLSRSIKILMRELLSIHPVFHISLLKKAIGLRMVTKNLPKLYPNSPPQPVAILDKRWNKAGV
ncbi:unnamed protein product [Dovyalis caffra]|uniref:Uncharacterized protein n=1 Tax=Dovyalis caffra TaxID=77055 RepID=A0AAV1R5J2_9ROSI|nr:unnamed protein product [Dovyalis caffra]